MSKLLPCPFCGFDDELYPSYRWPGNIGLHAIDCLRCGIDFVPREGMDVIAAWNKRPSQSQPTPSKQEKM